MQSSEPGPFWVHLFWLLESSRRSFFVISFYLVILDLAGFAALLLWGVHMVQTGVQRAFGPKLHTFLAAALSNRFKALGVSFSPEGQADLVRMVDRVNANVRLAASLFVSGDDDAARLLVAEKETFRAIETEAVNAHYQRLQSGNVSTMETSSLHLDALRDLKQVNSHLIEGAAYPVLRTRGALLPTRLRTVAKRS